MPLSLFVCDELSPIRNMSLSRQRQPCQAAFPCVSELLSPDVISSGTAHSGWAIHRPMSASCIEGIY